MGNGNRTPGINWVGKENILNDRNNSYNKDKTAPLYEITLTSSIIQDIRLYNKNTTYDDYNFICKDNGTICISKYLSCLKKDGILSIPNRTNEHKFNTSELNQCP